MLNRHNFDLPDKTNIAHIVSVVFVVVVLVNVQFILVSPSYNPFLFRTSIFSFFPPHFFLGSLHFETFGKFLPIISTVI